MATSKYAEQEQLLERKKNRPYAVKSMGAGAIKDVDLTKKTVTGFYNSFKFFDSDCDVLLPGCSTRSITQHGPASAAVDKIKHLLFHDWTKLPGKITTLDERKVGDIEGIYFETKMSAAEDGQETLTKYQEEIYDNHSIGFNFLDGEFVDNESENWQKYLDMLINPEAADAVGWMFLWKEIRLYEGSTVAFGANSLTPYLGVKSASRDELFLEAQKRFDCLEKQIRKGEIKKENAQTAAMQLLQLKQYMVELFELGPSKKDTLRDEAHPETTQENGINFSLLNS